MNELNGISNEMLDSTTVPDSLEQRLESDDPETLMKLLQENRANQESVRDLIKEEQASSRDDEQRAWERRQDYGPMIKRWLEMLAQKEDVIKELAEEAR